MNKSLLAVTALVAALAAGQTAQAQEVATTDELLESLRGTVPAGAEVFASTSDTATPEDETLVFIGHPGLADSFSLCSADGGKEVKTEVAFSLADLQSLAGPDGRISLDLVPAIEAYESARDKTFTEPAPEDPASPLSTRAQARDYHFTQMANDFEAVTGVTLTVMTAVYDAPPGQGCQIMSIQDMFLTNPPELQQMMFPTLPPDIQEEVFPAMSPALQARFFDTLPEDAQDRLIEGGYEPEASDAPVPGAAAPAP